MSGSPLAKRYDALYGERLNVFGGGKQSPVVVQMQRLLPAQSTILEMGAGQGRNSLYLASFGHIVTARDISDVGLQQITDAARENGWSVATEQRSAIDAVSGVFGGMISTLMLHHLLPEQARLVVASMQSSTIPGGFHALELLCAGGDFAFRSTHNFFPSVEDALGLYPGWDVLHNSLVIRQAFATKEDGSHMMNPVLSLLVQKPL